MNNEKYGFTSPLGNFTTAKDHYIDKAKRENKKIRCSYEITQLTSKEYYKMNITNKIVIDFLENLKISSQEF